MAILERDVVLQGMQDGQKTMDFPITRLANVEDAADVKEVPAAGDYIPVMDSADGGQMKKTLWSAIAGLFAAVGHKHTAADVGAAAAGHTHTAADVGAAAAGHTHTAADVGAKASGWKPFYAGTSAPSDTTQLWIDTTATTGGLKYHNGSAWVHVPVSTV